ncbi:MAG: hypothetical protein SPL45_09830, partial [Schwartzia succinivorans]|nr:hypothetical protein [Schwartzia succinivorans]
MPDAKIRHTCRGHPNGVISAVTIEARKHGWDVLGMYDGFSHLAKREKDYIRLQYNDVSRIHLTG